MKAELKNQNSRPNRQANWKPKQDGKGGSNVDKGKGSGGGNATGASGSN